MLEFSDKEYQNLRGDVKEVRSCITTYIGYIISATILSGLPGIVGSFIEKKSSSDYQIIFTLTTMIAVTFLFEIIWYKFKSHNRLVGYMQLMLQEQSCLFIEDIKPDHLENGKYIKDYKKLLKKKKKTNYSNEITSWEVIMAAHNRPKVPHSDETLQRILKSSSDLKYVFSMPDKYGYSNLKNYKDLDSEFFKEIIFKVYGESGFKEKKRFLIISYIKQLFVSLRYLVKSDSRRIINDTEIDRKYLVSGWKYPKEVTRIAFFVIVLLGCFSAFLAIFHLHTWSWAYLIVILFIIWWWLHIYVVNIKDIVYGKNSIDGYCWSFFLSRVRTLNTAGIIPIYFSRNFIRFFKSKMIFQILTTTGFGVELRNMFAEDEYELYLKKIQNYRGLESINDEKEIEFIHKKVVECIKKRGYNYHYE